MASTAEIDRWSFADLQRLAQEPDPARKAEGFAAIPGASEAKTAPGGWIVTLIDEPECESLYCYMPANARSNAHRHPDTDEFITMLDGVGAFWIDGTMNLLRPGDSLRIPKESAHSYFAITPTWFYQVSAPRFDRAQIRLDDEANAASMAAQKDVARP